MDLTPKQQVSELLRQAQNILIVTGREPNNDQLASSIALASVLGKLGKTATVVITDKLPKLAQVLDTSMVATDMQGARDFVMSIDMHKVQVDKVRYDVNGDKLDITITPHGGNYTERDVTFGYGAYQFDLVVALGVPSIGKLDRLHEQNPTIFDGFHLLNIDFHRINENYGSVNLVDTAATCVAEILISVIESLGQGMIDPQIATAFLGSFMSATANFTAPSTTAKALTIAAQMMSAGGKQQEIVKALGAPAPASAPARQEKPEPAKQPAIPKTYAQVETKVEEVAEAAEAPAPVEPIVLPEPQSDASESAPEQDGSKKNAIISQAAATNKSTSQASTLDHGQAALAPTPMAPAQSLPTQAAQPTMSLSPLEASPVA